MVYKNAAAVSGKRCTVVDGRNVDAVRPRAEHAGDVDVVERRQLRQARGVRVGAAARVAAVRGNIRWWRRRGNAGLFGQTCGFLGGELLFALCLGLRLLGSGLLDAHFVGGLVCGVVDYGHG